MSRDRAAANATPSAARFGWVDFSAAPDTVARRLIGAHLQVAGVGGIIVETEAYDPFLSRRLSGCRQ